MRKCIIFLMFFFITANLLYSQSPDQINYQAVLRDADGKIIVNKKVSVVIDILKGSLSGLVVFTESHTAMTNSYGVVNIKIGSVSDMSKVDWSLDSYFVKITVDGNEIGVSQLLSVPYALYSTHAGAIAPKKSVDLVKALSESDYVEIPSGTYDFSSQINVPSGKTIRGISGKTILRFKGSNIGLNIDSSNDVVLENLILQGDYPDTPVENKLNPVARGLVDSYSEAYTEKNVGIVKGVLKSQVGIRINGGERVRINGCVIKNFSSYGIYVSLSGKKYINSIQITNNYIMNNYCGIKTDKEAERMVIDGNYITLNQIGFYMNSGANMIDNTSFNANRVGMVLADGPNHAHGVVSNSPFTHCSLFGLVAYNVKYGQLFNGCKFGYGDVYLYKSKGIFFNACQLLNLSITSDGKWTNGQSESGVNIIHNCCTSEGVNIFMINKGYFDLKNNFSIDGIDALKLNN